MLERKVGKQRPFWRGFLLTIVTLGLYAIYWNYKAHDEVFKQFELEDEGRDEGIVWFILGLIIGPIILVYQYKFVENINHVRHELDLGEGVSSVEFLLWVTVGVLLLFIGPIVGYYKLQTSINEVWEAYETEHGAAQAEPAEDIASA